jgi:hypothetical protein
MPRGSFDDELARLQRIAGGTITDDAVDALRGVLKGSQAVLAALAAEIAGLRRVADLEQDMVRAFNRFMANPDKGCQAKTAIAEALQKLDHVGDEVYLRGIRHVQMEPVFGGKKDMADDLRASCAVALANMRHPKAPFELTRLLVDPEINPRRTAIKALAHLGTEGAEMVIRLKALQGDAEPTVMGECFAALLSISPATSVGFVREFLESSLEVAEQAALALGQSHEAEAFEILREVWETNVAPDFRRMLIVPISLLRRDDAFDFLLDVIENSGPKLASEAVTALAVYADDRSRRKVRDAVQRRDDPTVTTAFTRAFGSDSSTGGEK